MNRLTISLPSACYDIVISKGALNHIGDEIRQVCSAQNALILTDENVAAHYLRRVQNNLEAVGIKAFSLILPAGEGTKSLACLERVYSALCEHRLTRTDVLVALGGGVIGDLGGFAAATYLRGIPYVQVPTSLLAQVDSSVGGKVAIDLPQGKNLAGAFYHPALVVLDPNALDTLPDRIFFDGMGEVIKYGCIADEALFRLIEQCRGREGIMAQILPIITRCLEIKRTFVQQDEKDTGIRMALNFGHTLGHAIEAAQGFEGLRHGEAVCVGIAQITKLSQMRGLTREGTYERLAALLNKHGLPVTTTTGKAVMDYIERDKKNVYQKLNVILLKSIGEYGILQTDAAFLKEAEEWLI